MPAQLSRHSQFVQNPFSVNLAFAGTELGTFAFFATASSGWASTAPLPRVP